MVDAFLAAELCDRLLAAHILEHGVDISSAENS